MSEAMPRKDLPAIAQVGDPHVRRALREVFSELRSQLECKEMEIHALLELMLEKHVFSIGEYKRHIVRAQQGQAQRAKSALESVVASAQRSVVPARPPAPAAIEDELDEAEDEQPSRRIDLGSW